MLTDFNGKVALVTGASSGIGRATALKFACSGAKLMLTGRKIEQLKKVRLESGISDEDCRILGGDITDIDFRNHLIDSVRQDFERLDILVNAAGVIASGTIENTTLDDFDKMMDINVRSVFHLIQISLPLLMKSRGNVLNVSSVTGLRSFPGIISYCISKSAVDQLTRVAALELAGKGIRVNAVNPGVVETNLHRRSGYDEKTYSQFLEHSKSTHPLGRVGQPEEVADLILFLASDQAGWLTGLTTSVDGGRHLTCAR